MALSCSRRPADSGKTEKQASRTVRIETITITLPLHNEHGSSAGKSVPVLPEMQPLTGKNGLDQIGASFHFPAYFTRPNTEHFPFRTTAYCLPTKMPRRIRHQRLHENCARRYSQNNFSIPESAGACNA